MEARKIEIEYTDPAAALTMFRPETVDSALPSILVLPGGGYQVCAPSEADPIAEKFASLGFAAFVLRYSVLSTGSGHTAFPEPLREVAQTICYLRDHAAELGLEPEEIALFGASAGGHLAATYANGWDTPEIYEGFIPADGDPERLRPAACVYLYCAAAPGPEGGGMLPAMFGHEPPFSGEELECCAVKDYVGPQTPPTILFHSATDPVVPFRSSVELFQALQKAGVPSELHVFGSGLHASGLGAGTAIEPWPELAAAFLRQVFRAPETFERDYTARMQQAMFGA